MKRYLLPVIFLLATACTDTKKQEKDALNQVIKIHDEAMAKDENAVKNKMLLDSLAHTALTVNIDDVNAASKKLSDADKAMEDWMHQFNADYGNKSHDEIMQYLSGQQKQVSQVNNQLEAAIKQSNQVISTLQK